MYFFFNFMYKSAIHRYELYEIAIDSKFVCFPEINNISCLDVSELLFYFTYSSLPLFPSLSISLSLLQATDIKQCNDSLTEMRIARKM